MLDLNKTINYYKTYVPFVAFIFASNCFKNISQYNFELRLYSN